MPANSKDNVAIDGPAGAGKSTVARLLAARLAYQYLDTGAMYRALTLKALRSGLDLLDRANLGRLAETAEINLDTDPKGQVLVFLDGEDVSAAIRSPEVNEGVSLVAAAPEVRQRLVAIQRSLAAAGGVVMDGRDIGTRVMPEARHKFFLTATLAERARRRAEELRARGFFMSLEAVEAELRLRDELDANREVGPLRRAPDAVLINTDGLAPEEIAGRLYHICLGAKD